VYMAGMADDDPEGWGLYERTREAAGGDPDVHLLALSVSPDQVDRNALEVNVMQRGAAVVLQKSIREGFGLVVAEALWKEKAVVAGNVGGIRVQIRDGWNGHLVDSTEAAATRTLELLGDPGRRALFGRRGRELVADKFLFTRLLGQYLKWFGDL
jgi:trehalose synthase